MADAIPVADPGLLAAQAKAGQAGVDAYNAAITTLQGQKQTAIQTAMQEAAMRGSPDGAAQSQSGIISAPYDQRIASLTQNLGGYQAAQSARTTRMNDYNAATLAARSYIPQQVELVTGPIRAQADFNVRNTQMEGEQRVAGINAEQELTLAKMAAAFQAAQIAAAKAAAAKKAAGEKQQTLSQGELSGLMTTRAAQQLNQSGDQIRQILSANEAETLKRAKTKVDELKPAEDATRNQNYWDLMAAAYTGKGMQEEAAKPKSTLQSIFKTAAGNGAKLPLPMQVPGRAQNQPVSQDDELAQARAAMSQQATVNAGQFNAGAPPPSSMTPGATAAPAGSQAAMAMWNAINNNARTLNAQTSNAQMRQAGQKQISDLTGRIEARPNSRDMAVNRLTAGLGSLNASNNEFAAIDPDTGRRAFMTPEQAQGLDPFTREMLMGATQTQGINGVQDFENVVWGTPSDQNQGVGSPYSADVVKNAMVQVAQQLAAQGYEIDEGQVANALPAQGTSIYNLLAGQSGQPTSEQWYAGQVKASTAADKAAAADETAAGKEQTAQDKANETEARQGLVATYGRAPETTLGTPTQVLSRIANNKDTLDGATQLLQGIVQDWDIQRGGLDTSKLRTLLQQAQVPVDLIPLVLFVNGY